MIFEGRNFVAAFIAVFLFAPILWMLLDRDPPYEFEKVEIEPQVVASTETIYITFQVKQTRAVCGPGLIYRQFREEPSGKLHIYDPIQRADPPVIENNRFTRMSALPANMTPGLVTYRGTSCYTCNPVQAWLRWPVCVTTPDVPFVVLEKPK